MSYQKLSATVTQWFLKRASHERSIALMKFLSEVTRRLGISEFVYVVGGAVRNFILNQPIKDIDVVIDSIRAKHDSDWLAKQIARAIPVNTSLITNQYGVAILTIKDDWILGSENLVGEVIEIANARKESYGKGDGSGKGYKPTEVEPSTIEEDLKRREFTFNTLLWRLQDLATGPEQAEILDLTGCGRKDLAEGILRCPSDPDKTFSDDPTRILRAIKFTGKYGFKIPADVALSITRNADKMKRMPWEAIASILINNVLNEPTARASLQQMDKLGILDVIKEMIQEQRPFAAYMANQLRTNRKLPLLLDMMDLGIVQTPLFFLTEDQRSSVRTLLFSMNENEMENFVERLIKPQIDSTFIIEKLGLAPKERNRIIPLARSIIIENPQITTSQLTQRVIREWE